MERYRSGHNEAVLKTVCPKGRVGSNPTLSAKIFGGLYDGDSKSGSWQYAGGFFRRKRNPTLSAKILGGIKNQMIRRTTQVVKGLPC